MGRDAIDSQVGHELPGVVALVATQGFLVRATERTGHPQLGFSLRPAGGLAAFTGDHQAFAVLHDAVPQEAQESAGARSLLEQTGFPIACGAVGLVGEQQAAEVTLGTLLSAACLAKSFANTGRLWDIIQPIDPLQ